MSKNLWILLYLIFFIFLYALGAFVLWHWAGKVATLCVIAATLIPPIISRKDFLNLLILYSVLWFGVLFTYGLVHLLHFVI